MIRVMKCLDNLEILGPLSLGRQGGKIPEAIHQVKRSGPEEISSGVKGILYFPFNCFLTH